MKKRTVAGILGCALLLGGCAQKSDMPSEQFLDGYSFGMRVVFNYTQGKVKIPFKVIDKRDEADKTIHDIPWKENLSYIPLADSQVFPPRDKYLVEQISLNIGDMLTNKTITLHNIVVVLDARGMTDRMPNDKDDNFKEERRLGGIPFDKETLSKRFSDWIIDIYIKLDIDGKYYTSHCRSGMDILEAKLKTKAPIHNPSSNKLYNIIITADTTPYLQGDIYKRAMDDCIADLTHKIKKGFRNE